jgi:phage N-6-adenine-methyltransferase
MVAQGRRGRAIYDARQRRVAAAGQLPLAEEIAPWGREDWTPDHWETPWEVVYALEAEFGPFELDPCATPRTAKAPRFFTEADDGLRLRWAPARTFCNPPYSSVAEWLQQARVAAAEGSLVVCLLPARTDRDWFHDLVLPFAEVRFIRGRQRFIGRDGTTVGRPFFASMLAVYRPTPPATLAPAGSGKALEANSDG